jgi:hypothetical protein
MERDLKMDPILREEIRHFFRKEWEWKLGTADDFMIELEEFLMKEGFDLSCVLQYKKK